MPYAEITFQDRNPIKRWLQRKRLEFAMNLIGEEKYPASICDFGAGNGELCKLLRSHFPAANIACYEPTSNLLAEAKENLRGVPNIKFWQHIDSTCYEAFDVIFCLEVFEHLPNQELINAIKSIHALLKPGGIFILGVPNEIGIPALYKGEFRMSRRYGAYDAKPKNIAMSLIGKPPKDRPVSEIAPGIRFHYEHMGFDWRRLTNDLQDYFCIQSVAGSPISSLSCFLMPEIYFLSTKC